MEEEMTTDDPEALNDMKRMYSACFNEGLFVFG